MIFFILGQIVVLLLTSFGGSLYSRHKQVGFVKGGDLMENAHCHYEKTSKYAIGTILLVVAAILFISGLTILPLFGLFLAIPILFISLYFFRVHLNRECQIADSK